MTKDLWEPTFAVLVGFWYARSSSPTWHVPLLLERLARLSCRMCAGSTCGKLTLHKLTYRESSFCISFHTDGCSSFGSSLLSTYASTRRFLISLFVLRTRPPSRSPCNIDSMTLPSDTYESFVMFRCSLFMATAGVSPSSSSKLKFLRSSGKSLTAQIVPTFEQFDPNATKASFRSFSLSTCQTESLFSLVLSSDTTVSACTSAEVAFAIEFSPGHLPREIFLK